MNHLRLRQLAIVPREYDTAVLVLSVMANRGKASERKYFTEAEALALVGKAVRSRRAWSGIREGSTGRVSRAAESASRHG
jgi:hypothetical protein